MEQGPRKFAYDQVGFEAIVVHDGRTVLDASPQIEELLGIKVGEVIGQPIDRFVMGKSRELVQEAISTHRASAYEVELMDRAGMPRTLEIRGRTIDSDAGELRIAAVRDVTARKQLENALRREQETLEQRVAERTAELEAALSQLQQTQTTKQAVYAALPDMILLMDRQGRFLDCRPTPEVEYYVPPEVFLGKLIEEVLPADVAAQWHEAAARLFAGSTLETFEYQLDKPGGVRDYEARLSRCGEDRAITVIRDITDRASSSRALHHRERTLAAICRASELFIRSVDWRTPLPAVLQLLGEAEGAHRCFLAMFLGQREDDTSFNLIEEWCAPGISSGMEVDLNFNFPAAEEGFRPHAIRMRRGEILQIVTASLPPGPLRELLEVQKIVSSLAVPVPLGAGTWGFLGFDDCVAERRWDGLDSDALRAAAASIGAAIERQEGTRKIRAAEERSHRLLEGARVVAWEADLAVPRVLHVSAGAETLLGYPLTDWYDFETCARNFHPEDYHLQEEALAHATRTGEDVDIELRMVAANGRIVWVRSLIHPPPPGTSGGTHQGFLINITERKEASLENARLAAIARESPMPILEFSVSCELLYANPAAEQLAMKLGLETVMGLLPPEHGEHCRQALESGAPIHGVEAHFRSKVVSWSYSPVVSQGRLQLFGMDMTEQRELRAELVARRASQQQSQKMEVVGRITSGIVHDFNNMLAVIRGYSAIVLRDRRLPEHLGEAVERIAAAAGSASQLSKRLLSFSRKSNDSLDLVDANDVVNRAIPLFERLLRESITLHLDPCNDLLPVRCIPTDLQQVILNLVINASDAMPDGGTLLIASGRDGENGEVIISISDTGTGIPPEIQEQIFEPYFTTKPDDAGTGIGLKTALQIVESVGGRLAFDSQPGRGTTFDIILPLHKEDSDSGISYPSAVGEGVPNGSTVLVVDDEDGVRDLAAMVLRQHGYKTLSASNGSEAWDLCQSHEGTIDLTLTDVVMPEMNGVRLASILRKAHPAMKIVLMSGFADHETSELLADLPGVPFLEKPFKVDDLSRIIDETIRNGTSAP